VLYTPFLTDGGYTRVAIHGRWREQEGLCGGPLCCEEGRRG